MELFALYLQFLSEICEGTRPAPAGITVPASGAEEKIQAVQQAALEMGIDAFVRACAEAEGREVPQEWYDNFDLAQVMQAMGQFGQAQAAEPEAPAETAPADAADDAADQTPKIEEPDGPRNACEVLLDCCLLEDDLFSYLVELLKTKDELGFFRLSQVTARKQISLEDFLIWLGNKELDASEEEQACVAILDACLQRVADEGDKELLAALLSGDQKTFELFRCQAPELVHLPEATYDWYSRNYLDQYYPVRFMMRLHGVTFPTWRG